ncbi:conserved hypothetical protein [Exiguobacterium sp. 8A]|nr:conserved hypothetical protein [Exiguobacterium sp. 8A]
MYSTSLDRLTEWRGEVDDIGPLVLHAEAMKTRTRRSIRLAAVSLLAGSVVLAASGCAFVQQQTGDAWAVTYEIRVDDPTGSTLSDIRVEGAEARGDESKLHKIGTEATTRTDGAGSAWVHEAVVLAKQRASVSATPAPGVTAECRILLDGKREIAKQTSDGPGEPVDCSVRTPSFK